LKKFLRSTAISKDLRTNHRIRISPIRLIDQNDKQIGIVETRDAIRMAMEVGYDLVEVAPMAKPPVCRIMDFGKYKYALNKKQQKAKAHRHETELKEVRIRTPKIGAHDLEIKLSQARKFLDRGDRVQFSLRFRGRELAHTDEGMAIFEQIRKALGDVAKVDQPAKFEGKRITMMLATLGKQDQRKHSENDEDESSSILPDIDFDEDILDDDDEDNGDDED